MAVAFVAGAFSTYASRSSNDLTKPAGTLDGHLMVMHYVTGFQTTAPTPTWPSGWTVEAGYPRSVQDGSLFQVKLWVLTKPASGEGASYSITHATASCQGWIGTFSGVDLTIPVAPASTYATANVNAPAPSTAPGLTTTRDGSMILYVGIDWGDTTNDLTPPTGMTEIMDTTISYVAYESIVTAGATGTRTHNTNAAGGNPVASSLVALQPPAAGSTFTYNRGTDVWPNIVSAPSAVAGQTYFDSTTQRFMQYNGTVFKVVG